MENSGVNTFPIQTGNMHKKTHKPAVYFYAWMGGLWFYCFVCPTSVHWKRRRPGGNLMLGVTLGKISDWRRLCGKRNGWNNRMLRSWTGREPVAGV